MWTFYFLFLLLTAVGMFPPRWEHSHRGENILTVVETFPPRWEHSHRGEKYFHRSEKYFHRSENIPTAVGTISLWWEHSHRGENIPTAVRTFPPRWEVFPPRWKHSHRGENIPTAVRTFLPRWLKHLTPSGGEGGGVSIKSPLLWWI